MSWFKRKRPEPPPSLEPEHILRLRCAFIQHFMHDPGEEPKQEWIRQIAGKLYKTADSDGFPVVHTTFPFLYGIDFWLALNELERNP